MKILTHNVYWFQGVSPTVPSKPGMPVPEILQDLAMLYQKISADAVCLQEIPSPEAFQLISGRLQREGAYQSGGEFPEYGGTIFWGQGGRWLGDSGGARPPFKRVWQMMSLPVSREAQADSSAPSHLTVCGVHLPSSVRLGEEEAAQARVGELRRILTGETRPDVIAGDFNEKPGGPVTDLLNASGYLETSVLTGKSGTTHSKGSSQTDFIWIHSSLGKFLAHYEAVPPSAMACRHPDKIFLSDHLPVWIELRL